MTRVTPEMDAERRAAYDREDCDRCAGASLTPPLTAPSFCSWRWKAGLASKNTRGKPCRRVRESRQGHVDTQALRAELVEERRRNARLAGTLAEIARLAQGAVSDNREAHGVPAPVPAPVVVPEPAEPKPQAPRNWDLQRRLHAAAPLKPVARDDEEGDVAVEAGFDPKTTPLSGNERLLLRLLAQNSEGRQESGQLRQHMPRRSAFGAIRRLEARGYVNQRQSFKDARVRIVTITALGRAAVEKATTPSQVRTTGQPGKRLAEDLAQAAAPNLAAPLTAAQRRLLHDALATGCFPEDLDHDSRDALAGIIGRGLARLPVAPGPATLTHSGRAVAGRLSGMVPA